MSQRTLFDELKYKFQSGNATVRLIFINALVFVSIKLMGTLDQLIFPGTNPLLGVAYYICALQTDLSQFVYNPLTLITSLFTHFDFWHILMNMLFLYFAGTFFESYFGSKKLVRFYIIGGIVGCLFELLAHLIFPALRGHSDVVVGASGSIMAVFAAMAYVSPNTTVQLFGIIPVRLIYLAGFFILTDLFSLGSNDQVAHFAHIGGVVYGILAAKSINRYQISASESMFGQVLNRIKGLFVQKPKLKKTGSTRSTQFKTDEDYNLEKKQRQEKIDAILDKISKSGYESLTKAEKAFLFDQSKHG